MRETTIGGARWSLNTLPAAKGLEVLTWLGAVLGTPAGEAGGSVLTDASLDPQTLGRALGALTSKLSDPVSIKMIRILLADVRRDDKAIAFDDYFAGNYGELAQLVVWAIQENFRSFFVGNPALIGLVDRAKAVARSKQKTSTGDSGA